jgi:NAD(P)-dependent dehydrogenase (short-subunit alcohol dehydrogenase family)
MMHINTTSCFLAIKYAAPAMKKLKAGVKDDSNGSIILTASVAALRSGAGPVHCESSLLLRSVSHIL